MRFHRTPGIPLQAAAVLLVDIPPLDEGVGASFDRNLGNKCADAGKEAAIVFSSAQGSYRS